MPLLREPETVGNWRAAVKRTWHAASKDPRVPAEPAALEDLFCRDCALALVRAVRSARRHRIEAEGGTWRPEEKGRYEASLLQTLISVGRALRLDDDRLGPIVELTHQIDPAVVGTKIMPDGERKLVHADRRIGPRHEDMLRPFGDLRVLGRWLGAPGVLWAQAERKSRGREAPTLAAAALARSALVARIAQRVCPLRRTNLARLRVHGEERHIHLPVGDGAGWLDLPACEMKNHRAVRVRIDPDTVGMIRRYVDVYRHVLAKCVGAHAENEHLFPGSERRRKEQGPGGGYAAGMGYLTREKLTASFGDHMWRHCRLRLDLHVMRHLAGKIILDQDPSAMRLVQEVLGHKRIETTQSYYAEVSGIVAQARYVELLDRATRQALRTISFRIDLRSQIGG